MNGQAGKGSDHRPVSDWKEYRASMDRIFGEKPLNIMEPEAPVDKPQARPILSGLNKGETNVKIKKHADKEVYSVSRNCHIKK